MSLLFISCLGFHSFPSKKQVSFNFMAAVTVATLEPKKRKSVTASTLFPIYLLWWSDENGCHHLQFSSVAQLCPTLCDLWTAARQASLSITNSQSSLKLMSIESGMPFSHLILCCPLLLLLPISPSIRVFSNQSALRIRWPKYWSFSFKISPSNEHPGLISFRMDWLDLLAVQGTLKSLL